MDTKTVILTGGELKAEDLGGQNANIFNLGSAAVYVSRYPGVTPGKDNVAEIPAGGFINLRDANGTVYLSGTGRVQLEGTDYACLSASAVMPGNGGSASGGVSKEYVDSADAITLSSAKKYTDDEIAEIEEKIPVVPEALPANGGNAETAEKLATPRTINGVEFDGSGDIEIDAVTQAELADLKAYIGYTDSDIYGLEADFENNRFTRLAGAVGKNPGADFDSVNAFGGRRRCSVVNDGTIIYNYDTDGWNNASGHQIQCMVEQPKFYYKVVPLKAEKIDGTDGYHLRKARYYISDTPKAGFKVHPAFVQNGIEIDKIYLSAFEGCIATTNSEYEYLLEDEQTANFDTAALSSIGNAKPASGTTQALTIANARKLAQNRGAGWGITTIQTLSATQLLFAIEYATFDSQAAIGNGVVNATETIRTGSTASLGNTSGSVESGGVSYRGEENLWGNIRTWIDNIQNTTSVSGYTGIKIDDIISGIYTRNTQGFINAFGYSPNFDFCFIASDLTGSSALPVGDYTWNLGVNTVWSLGGGHSEGNKHGVFATHRNGGVSASNSISGARLIYIPRPEEVTA